LSRPTRKTTREAEEKTLSGKRKKCVQKEFDRADIVRDVRFRLAAPTERKHPPGTERIFAQKECEWKDGDRGGLAEWEQTHGKKKESGSVP
jgi:hypothetical protein